MYACFNNCDPKTNGELALVKSLPPNLIVFDIGTRADSEFTDYPGIVHYFEPMPEFIDKLSKLKTLNTTSYYNQFGLSDSTAILNYYPRYQSFHNRTVSCSVDDSKNVIKLNVKTANEYISEHKIIHIDFIKIDTEGHELHVLKGFGTYLNIVDRIQFEYGGTYKDTSTTLLEVITFLRTYGFTKFSYLSPSGNVPITDYSDHYKYCNILCER